MLNAKIEVDPTDLESMIKLMDDYADSSCAEMGENERGEVVSISIFHDHITVVTWQDNGWIRNNTYWRDGTSEELFEGKEE